MAKCIPNYIDPSDRKRDGERLVMKRFSQNDMPGVALYSVKQHNDKLKMVAEVDFLYICSRGIICFEVKGGQSIYRVDDDWYSLDKNGVKHNINNPFVQAEACYYNMRNLIKDTYGAGSRQQQYLLGYGVIFPECIFAGTSSDLNLNVMFDCKWNLPDFRTYVEQVFDYWEERESIRQQMFHHEYHRTTLSDSDIMQLVNLICGDCHVVPSMKLTMQNTNERFYELTENQKDALELSNYNPRVVITGGAGTGKSLLAFSQVRRMAAREKRVLYLCYNKNMAEYARENIEECEFADISTYHAFMMKILKDFSLYKLSVEQISKYFLNKSPTVEYQYDYLVVDEGQDVLRESVFDVLEYFLKDGLEKGKWTFYLDRNQNIYNKDPDFDIAWELMTEIYQPTIYPLRKNCRNTKQISRATAALTRIPPERDSSVDGQEVIAHFYGSKKEFYSLIKQEIGAIINGGISPNNIVILSRYHKDNSILSDIDTIYNIPIIEREDLKSSCKNVIDYYTIQSYKGIERDIVIMVDVDGFESDEDVKMNYVGMTRAKVALIMLMKESLKSEYTASLIDGLLKL